MSSIASPEAAIPVAEPSGTEVWFCRIFIVIAMIAGTGLLCHLAVSLWAQHEFTQPESVVGAQSMMLAHDGTLYYELNKYPYTVSAYMPVFYGLEAGLIKIGVPVFRAGRLISFAALLGIFILSWRLLMLYTDNRYCAWTGTLLCASTSVLLTWGTVAQVDTLAVLCALCAFYQYSRYSHRGESTLVLAAAFAIAAFFTKQTMIACPATIFVLLWFQRRRVALRFGAGLAAVILAIVLVINVISSGRFIENTLFANLNPFALEKLNQHLRYLLVIPGGLIVVAAAGARRALHGDGRALFLYMALAALVLAITAPKIGSDLNYQIEPTVLLILCACMALHVLGFFPLFFSGAKTWVTLLHLPLALYLVLNFRLTDSSLRSRIARERQFRQQAAALQSHVTDGGRVLSTDLDAMVHLRGRLEVEPVIYKILVQAGRVNPEPLRRDLAAETFSTILLYQDVNRPFESHPEIPTLTDAQISEIRKHYRLVDHIGGPYLGGIYVYKPAARAGPPIKFIAKTADFHSQTCGAAKKLQ